MLMADSQNAAALLHNDIPQLPPKYVKQHLDAIQNNDSYCMLCFKVYLCPKVTVAWHAEVERLIVRC
jgi:GT2 family glycosyltransferase